ncbi:MAG: DUF4382 domain-containing protein [Gammaproteobacteria bacterium]|nr:DUF4382 domain-containing protein [Gammaproteobacteria bacterium]
MNLAKNVLLSAVALGLAACGGETDPPSTGAFSLSITDAPVDGATAVWVYFTGIELHGPSGTISIDAADKINLMALQGNNSELLASVTDLEAGNYQWMRLLVNAEEGVMDSYIEFDTESFPLRIPSGAQNGLKLNRPFVIAAGSRTDFTIDFDLRKSVHKPSAQNADYILRPTLRVVNNLEVGTVIGTVAAEILTNNNCAEGTAVYLFDGLAAVADDIDGLDAEPVTTANVTIDTNTGAGSYEIGFVEADLDYTVALTCTADLDDPEVDNLNTTATPPVEDVFFIDQQNITVQADTETIANF